MFRLSNNPAAISAADGLQDALAYLQKSWRRWVPVVGAIAAFSLLTYGLVGSLDARSLYHLDAQTGLAVWNADALSKLAGPIASGFASALVVAVGSWVFYATAIAGLRNRPLTFSGVVVRGLVTVLSGVIVAAAAIILVIGLILALVAVATVAPPVARLLVILLALAATPVVIYLLVRFVFTGLAIFDGFGPIEGIRESWRLSQGSVLRMFGWGVLALVMNIAIASVGSVMVALFSTTETAPLAQAASAALGATGSCLIIFMMSVLYESERARKDPTLYPYPAWPGSGSQPPALYAPGPVPAWPAGQYTPGPYPANPAAMPGWVAPGPIGPPPAWATNPANPTAVDPAAPGPKPAPMGNSGETDPTQQPPSAP